MFIIINARPGGHDIIFTENNDRLYYKNMNNTEGVYMINTV